MSQIFLSESHPETRTFQCRIIFYQRLQFFMVNHIRFFRTYIRVIQRFMNFMRLCINPFAVFIIFSLLRNLPNINFRIKVCRKSFTMISGIAIDNIQIVHFFKIMLCGISRIYTRYTRIKTATQNSCQSRLFETFLICPLPLIFKFSFIKRLIICRIQIIYTAS